METDSILIAETDLALLEDLRFFISSDLAWIELTVCTSPQQTVEQLSRSHYSTMIAFSQMIQEEASGILLQKRKRHPLVPLVLTAGHVDREAAHDALLHRWTLLKPSRVAGSRCGKRGSSGS
jgi:DNA-binding NtrC family response regulator